VVWKKWAGRDRATAGPWAPMPQPPKMSVVVPTSQRRPATWQYTTEKPPAGWTEPGFDASGWKQGPGGFGTRGTPGIVVGTTWSTDDIWLRRELTLPAGPFANLEFLVFHDEDVEIYVNGVRAAQEGGFITDYQPMEIAASALALLKPGAKITFRPLSSDGRWARYRRRPGQRCPRES
jgi:hypothetical protein